MEDLPIVKQGLDAVQPSLDAAQGIVNFGLGNVINGVFVSVTLILVIYLLYDHIKNGNGNKKILDALDRLTSVVNTVVLQNKQIIESFANEELSKIRGLMFYALDSNKHNVCVGIIRQIKEKNNIENRDVVEKSVRGTLNNLFKQFKSDIGEYDYNGIKLSEFCNDEWLELVFDYCIEAIYDGKEYHPSIYLRGLTVLFDGIKLEFFENLNKKFKK